MHAHWKAGSLAVAAGIALFVVPGAASAPPNDTIGRAETVASLPATLTGDTHGSKLSEDEPGLRCASPRGILWYSVKAPHRGPIVARLAAAGDLDAAVAVFRTLRSNRTQIVCKRTDSHGRAAVSWYAYREGSYLVGVAQRGKSAAGEFKLQLVAAEVPPHPPGQALPSQGVRTTIDPILDSSDAWSVKMARGTSYRINLTTPSGCISLGLYRPHTYSFALTHAAKSWPCGGYAVFTPGIDGGGLYSLVVRARGSDPIKQSYRLQVARTGVDDEAPGVELANGQSVAGRIFGRGIDAVDLYRFVVPRQNELTTLALTQKPNVGLDLRVIDETGGEAACACGTRGVQVLREHLSPGRYYAAVMSRDKSGGKYRLQLLVRDVTTTRISAGGTAYLETPPGTPVQLQVDVTSPNRGGRVKIEIDRFDPLFGWHFSRVVDARVDATGRLAWSWTPQSVGHWRARARFVGTPFSSFSQSGYVRVHVAEPLEPAASQAG